MVVKTLVGEHGLSERRACQASGVARSTLRYRRVARDDSGVITFIQAHMALNPRHGFGLLYDGARHQVIANALARWTLSKGIAPNHIQPGKPTQNAYVKRFNKTYSTEVLNCCVFDSLKEVRDMTAHPVPICPLPG